MPRPTDRPTSLSANKIFVDRDEPRELFSTTVAAIPADSAELLVFYGIGGQGKSALCREFASMLSSDRHRFRNIQHGFLNIKQKEQELSDPALLMLWLRDAFAVNKDLTGCGKRGAFIAKPLLFHFLLFAVALVFLDSCEFRGHFLTFGHTYPVI